MSRFLAAAFLAALVALGPAGCGDGDPASQIDTINALMAKDLPLTEQQRTDLERLIAEGNELVRTGNIEQAGTVLGEAIDLLKLAEDAAMFNKSE